MKKACLVVDKYYQKNKIFDSEDKDFDLNNGLLCFRLLKEEFKNKGYDLSTDDINTPDFSDIVIYNEILLKLPKKEHIFKSYLIINECEVIMPRNWILDNHKYFNKIFTWNDSFVDNNKYFKINFVHNFIKTINKDLSKKEKLCTLIAGNKSSKHKLELYSKRFEAIKWFENNHSNDFDFYGAGWDSYNINNRYLRYIYKKLNLKLFLRPFFLNYKGKVKDKLAVMEKYKFSICYENAIDIPGYITEKIFHSFFSGCVPIYLGANNIYDYVPKNCFIDKRNFDTYENLYSYLISMKDKEYVDYLFNIESFLNSQAIKTFEPEFFTKNIIKNILE